jgi:hypothetical protein
VTTEVPIRIISNPGIKRDGTLLEGDNYVDGQWCRFTRGLPKKMQGYRNVKSVALEKIYGLSAFASSGQEYLHGGSKSTLLQYVLDFNSTYLNSFDRTPLSGFNIDANNIWQMTVMYDAISANNRLIAHPGVNLASIDSDVSSNIFYGDITASTNLALAGGAPAVSGGICAVFPYLFAYGSAGYIAWSGINTPNDFTTGLGTAGGPGSGRVTGSKIIKGLPLRGNGSGPAGIFWSLDSLIRASFVADNRTFAFDTISDEISVMSSSGIVEVDGIFYWAAVDRFMMFNGVVDEVPNQFNNNWFFDNINYQYRQKCFALKIPRWGEIWWCYPRGNATECTDAVIYNYRDKFWYDTVLPNGGRTSGAFAKTYEHPFMTGLQPDLANHSAFRLWKHEETTKNEIDGSATNTIQSYFETNEISMLTQEQAQDKTTRVAVIEPDFVQVGDMNVTVRGRANARATDIVSEAIVFPDNATNIPDQQIITLEEVRRLMRFRFESNVVDGDYEMGHVLAHIKPADARRTD